MMEYNKLLDFIPYFEHENIEYYNWAPGYSQYDRKFDQFIKSAYQTEILKSDYLEYLDEKGINDKLATTSKFCLHGCLCYYGMLISLCLKNKR
ncbi:hypothetical protein JOC76_000351 [Neobacillus cucumis]|nr:hypothetical protein [Neobacillus cucumis]